MGNSSCQGFSSHAGETAHTCSIMYYEWNGNNFSLIVMCQVGRAFSIYIFLEGMQHLHLIYTHCEGKYTKKKNKTSSPSYKFNSVIFDSEKLSVETLWDHLKRL